MHGRPSGRDSTKVASRPPLRGGILAHLRSAYRDDRASGGTTRMNGEALGIPAQGGRLQDP
jgi:hypothetical protein